jgi:hypothetical protein
MKPLLCFFLVVLTITNFFVPDPIPYVDEIIMTLVSVKV